MTIFGKRLSEYVAFSKLFLGLILVVGIVRLALSLGGVPNSMVKWISINAVGWIEFYTTRFESIPAVSAATSSSSQFASSR